MAENEAGAAAVAPSAPSPCTGYCSQLVSQRPAGIAPWHSVRIVDVSLGIFNTRLHLRLPNVISGTTVACATVTCPQARPPLSHPSFPLLSPLLCPFLQCQSQQPQQCNGPQWSNGRLLLSMSLRYQLRTVGYTTECVCECECECVFTPILMPALTHIRCGNCDCALHLERMQKQTFYLSNICCMFSSFFAASVDKQPKPWQLESGVYTDRDRDMDRDRDRERERETSADFAQTVHKLIICRCK